MTDITPNERALHAEDNAAGLLLKGYKAKGRLGAVLFVRDHPDPHLGDGQPVLLLDDEQCFIFGKTLIRYDGKVKETVDCGGITLILYKDGSFTFRRTDCPDLIKRSPPVVLTNKERNTVYAMLLASTSRFR